MHKIILASVKCLPNLIDGKVCVIKDDNTYTLYKPSKYTEIKDGFDPTEYGILIHNVYSKCIVRMTASERTDYLVNQEYKKMITPSPVYRAGDSIHINSRRGIYRIVDIVDDCLIITCNKWSRDPDPNHIVKKSDFKCLAGGGRNM